MSEDGIFEGQPTEIRYDEPDIFLPLKQICLAIIDGNPDADQRRSRSDRLAIAMSALLGQPAPNGRRPAKFDEEILLRIAHRYFPMLWENPSSSIELAPIIRECVSKFSPRPPRTKESWDSEIRRLRNKFLEHKDYLTPQLMFNGDPDRLANDPIINSILRQLSFLGVPIASNPIGLVTDETTPS